MCPCRLERVSWPFDASVSAMIAYDLIFGAAAFAGLCAGVPDLFSTSSRSIPAFPQTGAVF